MKRNGHNPESTRTRSVRLSTRRLAGVAHPALLAIALTACGHPATRAECEEIFVQSAQLALAAKQVTDPAEKDRQLAQVRSDKGDEFLAGCIGMRITDEAMACVRGAQTAEQLDACLE